MSTASYQVAAQLARRMREYKELAISAQAQGDDSIELEIEEFWTVEDEAALSAFEQLALEQGGMTPLF